MTTTTAAAEALRFIPAAGITAAVAETTVQAFWVNGAGWKVQVRKDGLTVHSTLVRHEHEAVAEFNALVAKAEAEQPAEAPAPVKLPAASKGKATKVSDPGHTVLAIAASATDGIVRRGGKPGEATVKQINALAKRGYLALVHDETGRYGARRYVIGGRITASGQRRLAELTKADADAAQQADAIATVYSFAA